MPQQQLTGQQVAMAAAAGARLLEIKDLPVPMEIAKSGALSVLEQILGALVRGELVVTQAPAPEEAPGPKLVPDAEKDEPSGPANESKDAS